MLAVSAEDKTYCHYCPTKARSMAPLLPCNKYSAGPSRLRCQSQLLRSQLNPKPVLAAFLAVSERPFVCCTGLRSKEEYMDSMHSVSRQP